MRRSLVVHNSVFLNFVVSIPPHHDRERNGQSGQNNHAHGERQVRRLVNLRRTAIGDSGSGRQRSPGYCDDRPGRSGDKQGQDDVAAGHYQQNGRSCKHGILPRLTDRAC